MNFTILKLRPKLAFIKFFSILGFCLFLNPWITLASEFPLAIDAYSDQNSASIWEILIGRIQAEPFNLVVTIIFFMAIIHTFLSSKIHNLAVKIEQKKIRLIKELKSSNKRHKDFPEHSFKSSILMFLGEIEAVFMFWVIILGLSFLAYKDWSVFSNYVSNKINFTEPMFVVVIMAMAATKPIVHSAELILSWMARQLAKIFRTYSGSFWFVCMSIGSLLGSFITEMAAVTVIALLLGNLIYRNSNNTAFKYFTTSILLVNISIGGGMTNFAAPVIIIVANTWDITTGYMLTNFSHKVLLSVFTTATIGFIVFFKEFKLIDKKIDLQEAKPEKTESPKLEMPLWIIIIHYLFMLWTVVNIHNPVMFVGGFLIFLAFVVATKPYQKIFDLRSPLMVGLFLAGLIIHGGLQGWWIIPILSSLTDSQSFIVSVILSIFNDNAGVSYLASLLSDITESFKLSVLSGTLVGGGLTILANAPNPACFNIVKGHFKKGINHIRYGLSALLPTAITIVYFLFL